MYDLVLTVPPKSKRPYFSTAVAASGSLTYTSATYTLYDNGGNVLKNGTVDGHDAPDSLSVRVWHSIDAQNVDGSNTILPAGCSILDLLTLVTGSDTIARTEQCRILLFVPGVVVRTQMPTAADMQVFLTSQGLLANPPSATEKMIDLEGIAAEAKAAWEQGTSYIPFLATTQTRTYTPEGANSGTPGIIYNIPGLGMNNVGGSNTLFLHAGLLSVTTLKVSKTLTNPTGTTLTINSDFWLEPQSSPQYNKPYTYITFRQIQYGEPHSIEIVGSWGYCMTMTEDEFRAVLKLGAADAIDSLIAFKFGGLQSWTEADVTEKYDLKYGGLAEQYRATVAKALGRYRRPGIV